MLREVLSPSLDIHSLGLQILCGLARARYGNRSWVASVPGRAGGLSAASQGAQCGDGAGPDAGRASGGRAGPRRLRRRSVAPTVRCSDSQLRRQSARLVEAHVCGFRPLFDFQHGDATPCLQALTSACLAATSDGIAQRLLGASKLAWRRCTLMAVFGLLWYGALLRRLPPSCALLLGWSLVAQQGGNGLQ